MTFFLAWDRMEPPPLPRNQDCHEMWSKRRKRQIKEQMDLPQVTGASAVHTSLKPAPITYGQHKEQSKTGSNKEDPVGFPADAKKGENYEWNNLNLPTSLSNSPSAFHSHAQPSGQTPIGGGFNETASPLPADLQGRFTPYEQDSVIYRQVQQLANQINNGQGISYGQITALNFEQVRI